MLHVCVWGDGVAVMCRVCVELLIDIPCVMAVLFSMWATVSGFVMTAVTMYGMHAERTSAWRRNG